VGGQRQASAALPPGKTTCPFYIWLGWSQDRSARVRNISPPHQDSIPPNVQPVPSRYTDCAIPTHRSGDRGYTELTKDKNKNGHFSASNYSSVKLSITGIFENVAHQLQSGGPRNTKKLLIDCLKYFMPLILRNFIKTNSSYFIMFVFVVL